ncbi:putative molt-inhibiting hormone [Orchesella cincta]|uniref:Putative molt-inhibiting hormone n=1 Tax=Orchesella cincta TaxID=48709 RepID=A0A1D2MK25_ORCCI|nr:putative molt-inhibiting hormone [Orchesella cincta]
MLASAEKARFPDFSCHEEYNWDHPSMEGGEKYFQMIMRTCKMNEENDASDCYENCMLDRFYMLTREGIMREVETLTDHLFILFKNYNRDVSKSIASRIVEECAEIAEQTKELPCAEKTKLYECIDQAAQYKHMTVLL